MGNPYVHETPQDGCVCSPCERERIAAKFAELEAAARAALRALDAQLDRRMSDGEAISGRTQQAVDACAALRKALGEGA